MIRDVDIAPLDAERLVAVHASPVDALALLAPFDALRLGPEEWLCLDTTARMVASALGADALVLDVGDAYEGWRISGAGTPELLARICTLDVATLRPGFASRTAMAGLPVVLRILDGDCELRIERSYGAWFEAWLRRCRDG
jgi:heterotetrameric sarcosine oxidase gamma subunit